MKKVPKTFQLGGIVWRVAETDAISDMGHCDSETAIIRLRVDLPAQIKLATFCHELEHSMLFTMGRTDHDEREVDAHGNLLHQFLTTYK